MKSWLYALPAVCAVAALPAAAQTPADTAALTQIAVGFGNAWDRHDARALVENMAEDAVFVTAGARRLAGRAAIEGYHGRLFRGSASQSRNGTTNVNVRFVRPDVAMVERQWRIEGDRYSNGSPRLPRTGLMTMVAERRNARWAIAWVQNSNLSAPPRPQVPCACDSRATSR
jgi:uncharacterized protein (TIGR02246 family)